MENPSDQTSGAAIFAAHIDAMLTSSAGKLFADLPDGPLSYADCRRDMQKFSDIFAQLGLTAGDRAMILSGNDRATITLFLALLRAGITPVIADRAATLAEGQHLIALSQAAALFCDADHPLASHQPGLALVHLDASGQPKVANSGQPNPWPKCPDIALLVLTSGTTSTPKAVALTHANLLAQLDIFQQVYGFDPDTRLLNPLPLHHVDGLIRGPLAALWFGGSLHRTLPFSVQTIPALLASVAAQSITHLITVPAMLRMLDRVGRDQPTAFTTPTFRFVICSADLLDPALWRRFETTFATRIANAYGLSEVVCDALFAGPQDTTHQIGTLGRPVGCTARAVDDHGQNVTTGTIGELVLSGPTVMHSYFGAPAETAAVLKDGVFHTGDYVCADANGIYTFVGRKKTAIVSAGFTIHPETASQLLSTMPGVFEAVAFGLPDPAMGERLVAAIVPAPGQSLTAAEASAFCRAYLSPERSPREFRIVASLPRGASGKVILSDLAALMQDSPAPQRNILAIAARIFNTPVESLSFASTPFNTVGWDSLAHMTLIESLEDAFAMQFSAMQIAQIMSLEDANRFIIEASATP